MHGDQINNVLHIPIDFLVIPIITWMIHVFITSSFDSGYKESRLDGYKIYF